MSNARIEASDRRPVEEIDAIMVKYSAWAASRAADPPPPNGIREVTYSSALHASNARRKVRTDLVLPTEAPSGPPRPPRHTPKARSPKSSSARRPVADDLVSPAKKSRRPASAQPASAREIQPANRAVSLSVRLAPGECALIKSRAAESRLSVSAYVRQCVLDVDAMRIFVEKISAELHSTPAAGPFTSEPALLDTSAAHRYSPTFLARCYHAVLRLLSHPKKIRPAPG
jgi:hypothetical protein